MFITPVEVDSHGSYVTHDLSLSRHRSRRSLEDKGHVHYRLSAFGKELHLELLPATVIAEEFTIQTLSEDGVRVTNIDPDLRNCLYQGSVRNHTGSTAAVSTCTGLSGLIRMSHEEFFITPLPKHLALEHNYSAPAGHHPHVIYKRSAELHVHDEDVCKLYCIAEDFDFFFAMSSKVKDGTPCSDLTPDVCIDGVCESVGCDHVLGSGAALDLCGVCEGNNSTCRIYSGRYDLQHRANEYYPVVTVPAGARSVRVQELEISSSYLAVRGQKRGSYFLTSDWIVDWPGKFNFAGTTFTYRRSSNQPESLYAPGPTNQTLVFELLVQGKNPGVLWEYTLPLEESKHTYTWRVIRSDCSASCAGGRVSVKAVCVQDDQLQVNSSLCDAHSRPALASQLCQQSRTVRCLKKVLYQREELAPPALCPLPAPTYTQPCNTHFCPPEWGTGSWSQCSKTCGRGVRTRSVFCHSVNHVSGTSVPHDGLCEIQLKPKSQESCVMSRCPKNERLQWITTAWGECSVSCGRGVRTRELRCADRDSNAGFTELPIRRCRNLQKPHTDLQQACNRAQCPDLQPHPPSPGPGRANGAGELSWYSSPWQQCTVSCGGGVQMRSVQCLRHGRPSSGCLTHHRPASSKACNTHFCPSPGRTPGPAPKGDHLCVDVFTWCRLVPQHGVCNHRFYSEQCCRSCSVNKL
ncbi:A disintegrin and metalloproteinase with thrombospondin motifs 18 [Bagarius yarrelli]|uniref:A disintegrin and metalloproteinase with thrombospondin motifs 18 n=1 Tax=Bagarius yarrelli TaxID=175774 RepID=A0A556VCA6_BAGYA|nr:A disintegrin and metalloproteinase with thrombospondin motifs 18 [Bagarius yarrelli]